MARGSKKGAAAVARAHMGSKNRVARPGKPRSTRRTTQNSNLRLMVGASAGFDQTSGDHSLGSRVG